MNQQQPMMAGMNAGGGPVGVVPMNNHAMVTAAAAANTPGGQHPPGPPEGINTEVLLNTYIYDYFLKNHAYDLARALHNEFPLEIRKNGGKEVTNPINGHIDGDNKEHKRPTDLPIPSIATAESDSAFLADWWGQFWDIFSAHRGKGKASPASLSYMGHTRDQQRARQANQRMMGQMDPNVMRNYGMNAMGPNGMMLNNNLQKRALANSQNGPNLQQMQMKMQQQMGRDGNGMGMDGQRPQSPGSMENAPSPKRQRTDGNGFNGQPMGPLGRGQPMPGQPGQGGPMNQMMNGTQLTPEQFQQMQNNNPALQKQIEVYSHQLAQQHRTAMNNHDVKGINAGGVPQGASMGQQGDASDLFGGRANAVAGQNGNHALQDYQMQLMLLEQQNKRRLLMARQEQDNLTHAPPGPGQMGQPNQPGFGPNAMSPSGQRPGPSPNPSDQMKRGTPKMGPQNLPGSPMPDGSMPQNRNSPSANFDPSQIPQGMAPQQFYQQAAGMRPPSSHPQFPPGMSQQQIEAMRQRMPNGQMWQGQPNGPPQQMMPQAAQQGMPPNQQPGQMGTPRNAHMPPPPAPPASGPEQNRGAQQTSSPSQNSNAPPTPSQAPKAAPKGKKEANPSNKKKAPKKGGAGAPGATPASESTEAPTPTPSTPITPRHGSFQPNGTNQNPQAGSQAPNPGQNPAAQNAGPQMEGGQQTGFEGGLNGQDSNNMGGAMENNGVNLDFAMGGDDVLDNFDFDSFLQPGNDEDNTMFDPNTFAMFDGVEAGGEMS